MHEHALWRYLIFLKHPKLSLPKREDRRLSIRSPKISENFRKARARPFGLLDPEIQHVALAVRLNAQIQIDGFVADYVVVAGVSRSKVGAFREVKNELERFSTNSPSAVEIFSLKINDLSSHGK